MPSIQYNASEFFGKWLQLNGSHSMPIAWNDLLWAAITVGKPGIGHLFKHGNFSFYEVIVRICTVYANLKSEDVSIVKSSLYEGLNPTEKVSVSYFMGMLGAKLFAEKCLDIPWLIHMSLIRLQWGECSCLGSQSQILSGLMP